MAYLLVLKLTRVGHRRASFDEDSEKRVRGLLLGLLNGIKHPVSVAVWNWARGRLSLAVPNFG